MGSIKASFLLGGLQKPGPFGLMGRPLVPRGHSQLTQDWLVMDAYGVPT